MMKIDKFKDKKDDIVEKFRPFVCDNCISRLEKAGIPIQDRLNAGEKLRFRDITKLIKCVCPSCRARITQNSKGLLD